MSKKIGYARVSTATQNLQAQIDRLNSEGCSKVFSDKISGAKSARPGLASAMDALGKNDVLMVVRLDRLARSLNDLIKIGERLNEIGALLNALEDPWADTTTPQGRMILGIFGSLAEFERELILQRSKEGRERARLNGVIPGRPSTMKASQIARARSYRDDGYSLRKIADEMGIPKSTIERNLRKN